MRSMWWVAHVTCYGRHMHNAHSAGKTNSDFNEVAPNDNQTGDKNIICGCGWDRLSSMDKWITVNAMHARVPHLNSFWNPKIDSIAVDVQIRFLHRFAQTKWLRFDDAMEWDIKLEMRNVYDNTILHHTSWQ